jgi:hypothetical protein
MLPPRALTSQQIVSHLKTLGLHVGGINSLTQPVGSVNLNLNPPPASILSYHASFIPGGSSATSDVWTPAINQITANQEAYVEVKLRVAPQQQLLLDCSLKPDATYGVNAYFTPNGLAPWLMGSMTSINGHLLVPLSLAPAQANGARVLIFINKGVTFFGCQVDSVTQ